MVRLVETKAFKTDTHIDKMEVFGTAKNLVHLFLYIS